MQGGSGEIVISAHEALARLRAGNRRFVADAGRRRDGTDQSRRDELVAGQHPFAIILGCSDSRVPPEIVFDQGLGELFVIRVAGNIVAPSLIGSVEFATGLFGTPLVVVLGHSMCGAVVATLEELQRPDDHRSPNLQAIVDRIRPSVEDQLRAGLQSDPDELLRQSIRANVRASTDQLRQGSEIIEELIARGRLLVVGAEYSLATGVVDFFDGVPGDG